MSLEFDVEKKGMLKRTWKKQVKEESMKVGMSMHFAGQCDIWHYSHWLR